LAAFDERDWPPLRVLAWAWLRDPAILDDPKLSLLRLALLGALCRAPVERPAAAAKPPLPEGFVLASAPTNINPALSTSDQVENEIYDRSRADQLQWSGYRTGSNVRQLISGLAFADTRIEYNQAQLVRPQVDRAELARSVPQIVWHGLLTERELPLALWPPLLPLLLRSLAPPSPTRSSPSPPSAMPKPERLSFAEKVRHARKYYRDCVEGERLPSMREFGTLIGLRHHQSIGKIWDSAELPRPRQGGPRPKRKQHP
jgi:hypothetical protein